MSRGIAPTPAVERLAAQLLGPSVDPALHGELLAWLGGSRRYRAWVEANVGKVRKKLRGAADAEARRDVRAELRVAALLLADRRLAVGFEAYGSGRGGPDFTVRLPGDRSVNLEVTRVRREPSAIVVERLVLAKLRQLPPSAPNVIVALVEPAREGDAAGGAPPPEVGAAPSIGAGGVASHGPDPAEIAAAVRALRGRADRREEAFFLGHALDGTRDFWERFLRLGAIVLLAERASADSTIAGWRNASARVAVPVRTWRVIEAALGGGGVETDR
jgi:hypothetical protein